VPLQAVVHEKNKNRVAVKKPDGAFEWREVTLGVFSDKFIEVVQGSRAVRSSPSSRPS
jgi:hypothetical protein